MLVDDNSIDNFFHERVIRKSEAASQIVTMASGKAAIAHLQGNGVQPGIIFLDVNMPGMNGWEFIDAYKKLDPRQKCLIVVMTGDYEDPEDEALEAVKGVFHDFRPKPVTKEMLGELLEKYHSE